MIKASALAAEVRRLAQKYPDGQASCKYFNGDGTPCCIVGQALASLGADPEQFLNDNELNRHTGIESLVMSSYGIVEPDVASSVDFLVRAQFNQDGGWEWGYAVERADAGRRA